MVKIMNTKCLWCESDKEGGKVEHGKDFICGSCVPKLMRMAPTELREFYDKACTYGQTRRAEALSSFIQGHPREHLKI
jgi:hypothetical protein